MQWNRYYSNRYTKVNRNIVTKNPLLTAVNVHRLLDSLVVECWLRVREVPVSIPSQGLRHTKDVRKMVPVVSLFITEHLKGKILALSQELRKEINVMDTIWDRKSFEVAVVAGMKKPIDHAEPTKSNVKFIFYKKQKIQYVITTPFLRAIPVLYLITSKLCYTQQCLCGTNIRDFHSLINYPLIWLFRMSKRTYVHVYLDYITDTSHNVQDISIVSLTTALYVVKLFHYTTWYQILPLTFI